MRSGAFEEVFITKDNATEEVAIKVESNRTKHLQLLHEAKLSRKMKEWWEKAIAFSVFKIFFLLLKAGNFSSKITGVKSQGSFWAFTATVAGSTLEGEPLFIFNYFNFIIL